MFGGPMTELGKLGFGTWAMGGPFSGVDGSPVGWGPADDAESSKALQRAFELGVTLFDTADVYGCGHAEMVLGQALASVRDDVVIATKWGCGFDAEARRMT